MNEDKIQIGDNEFLSVRTLRKTEAQLCDSLAKPRDSQSVTVMCAVCGWTNAGDAPMCEHMRKMLDGSQPTVDILKKGEPYGN